MNNGIKLHIPPSRQDLLRTWAIKQIPDDIRNVCEKTLVNDGMTMLLFYHKDSVVEYAVMERSVADFASFDVSKKYSIRQQLFLDKERKVIVAH